MTKKPNGPASSWTSTLSLGCASWCRLAVVSVLVVRSSPARTVKTTEKKMNPEIYALSLIEWQLFASLTFKSERLADAVRLKMFFALMREQADNFGVHFKETIWCLRTGRLEKLTGRLHLHALIAGFPKHALTTATCFAFMKIWEQLGGGMARVTSIARCLTVWAMSSRAARLNTSAPAGIFMRRKSLGNAATSCFPSRCSAYWRAGGK